MRSGQESNWSPSPEMLAAYEDGEYNGPGHVSLKKQVEDWLEDHPQAAAELARNRRLDQIWQATRPAEPDAGTWKTLLTRIETSPPVVSAWHMSWRALGWMAGLLVASAAAILVAVNLFSFGPRNTGGPEEGVFIVATANEVEILSIAGADTQALPVGELPVRGPLELLGPGEVTVTSVQPAERDNMVPKMHDRPPMIWARSDLD